MYNISMRTTSFERLQPFFSALGNRDRFTIMCLLNERPRTVTELYQAIGAKQNKVSNDLKHLRECGYVMAEKQGVIRLYSINPAMQELLDLITNRVQELTTVCEACVTKENK